MRGKGYALLDHGLLLVDHPRVCGEKSAWTHLQVETQGSPPRMRGKGSVAVIGCQHRGITPAYAGKRGSSIINRIGNRDHPRVCGEKRRGTPQGHPGLGSPPRMRGKVCTELLETLEKRITPAYAGKRFLCSDMSSPCRDHPRVCGEKPLITEIRPFVVGSPPRMRGKVITRQLST